ncbi:MAG TPA: hypothetical protein VFM18_17620 [Methanosarcina sp.]|nr:hypothetical protein [Methanosarcina sp.]
MERTSEVSLAMIHRRDLLREFEKEEYGDGVIFFPDDLSVREGKFFLWLAKKYGFANQLENEMEQLYTVLVLKHQKV